MISGCQGKSAKNDKGRMNRLRAGKRAASNEACRESPGSARIGECSRTRRDFRLRLSWNAIGK